MIRVIDFETTGLPPEADVVEAAYVDVIGRKEVSTLVWSSLVRPTRPITVVARAAHHISDEEAAGGISWAEAEAEIAHGVEIFAAHNADFERQFFSRPGVRWIDTYKCALRLWPEAPKHTNQVLRYYLEGCDPGSLGMPPHRALPDCQVTARILIRCFEKEGIEQLVAWSDEPPLLPRVPLGKHRDKPWSEVPTDYLEWAVKQDFEPGMAHTVRVELKKRRK